MNHAAYSASPEPPESSAGSPGCPAWARKRIRELEIEVRALKVRVRDLTAEATGLLAANAALKANARELAGALRLAAFNIRGSAEARREVMDLLERLPGGEPMEVTP